MTAIQFYRGQRVAIDGTIYKMFRRNADGPVFENVKSLELVPFKDVDIERHILAGTITSILPEDESKRGRDPRVSDFNEQPEARKSEAYRRFYYVQTALKRGLPRSQKALIALIAEVAAELENDNPPSPATLCRWMKLLEEGHGDIRALLPGYDKRGNWEQRLPDEVEEIIWERLEYDYKAEEQITGASVWQTIDDEIRGENDRRNLDKQLPRVSLRTINRRIQMMDKYETMRARKGKKAADQKYGAVLAAPRATHAMDVVEIDHTRANTIVVYGDDGKILGRPWITSAICRYSRMIVGSYIGVESPSLAVLSTTIRNLILPKSEIVRKYGLETDYPCHGIPRVIVADNGAELHADGLVDSCSQIGTELQFCPVRTPRYKGKIERFFGTLATQYMNQLPGTTRSNIADRGDYDSKKNAFVSFDAFVQAYYTWLVEFYHRKYHRGLRGIPKDAWMRSTKERPVRPVLNRDDVIALAGGYGTRSALRTGVEFKGLFYNSQEFANMRLQPAFDERVKVKFRYDPSDIGSIFVFDPVKKTYLEVPAVEVWYAKGMTMFQHKVNRRHALEDVLKNPSLRDLSRSHEKVRRIIAQAVLDVKRRILGMRPARHMNLGNKPLADDLARFDAAAFMGPLPDALASPAVSKTNEEQKSDRGLVPTKIFEDGAPIEPALVAPIPSEEDEDLSHIKIVISR